MVNSNLLAEMQKDGFRGKRVSSTRGGEWHGPCILPGCKGLGTDRLRVQPYHGSYGFFECRACGEKGSLIDYLIIKRDFSDIQAYEYVGWKPKDGSTPKFIIPKSALAGGQTTHDAPSEEWQTAARAFCQVCIDYLWSDNGLQALEYLRARGLKDETIKSAKIGYNPSAMERPGAKWGRHGKLFLAQGIIIPWFIGEDIWRITIRDESVPAGVKKGRYKQVAGGSNGLYLADSLKFDRPVVITEGEIDALSVAQECGREVSVVATGTTGGSRTVRWISALARKDMVLIAFDAEREKGDKSADWWLKRLENAHRLRPWWDDANQMLQDGIDLLGDWVVPRIDSIFDELLKKSVPSAGPTNKEKPPVADADPPSESLIDTPEPSLNDDDSLCLCDVCLNLDDPRDTHAVHLLENDLGLSPARYCEFHFRTRREECDPYYPVSLPPLPRTHCPVKISIDKPVNGTANIYELKRIKCGQTARQNGFCEKHQLSYKFLSIGAELTYPRIEVPFEWRGEILHRTIESGIEEWEDVAIGSHRLQAAMDFIESVYTDQLARPVTAS